MNAVIFDTLAYTQRLERSGFTREQAEAVANANADALQYMTETRDLVTKKDLALAKADLEKSIAETRSELEKSIAETRSELEKSIVETRAGLEKSDAETKAGLEKYIAETKHELLKWLIGMMVAQTALITGLIAYLKLGAS